MYRFLITFILLFYISNTNAQEILSELNTNLDEGISNKRDTYQILNQETGELTLFLIDNYTVNIHKYDKNYQLKNSYECPRPKNKYRHIIGHTIMNNQYNLIYTTRRKKEFLVQTIDLNNKSNSNKKVPFKFKFEKYIKAITYNNKLYVLSTVKHSSILKLRIFNGTELSITKEFKFNQNRFTRGQFNKLSDVLKSSSTSLIDSNNPNSIDLTSCKSKIYCYNDKIVISLDQMKDMTILINIELKELTAKIKTYKSDTIDKKEFSMIKSNSYLYKNIIFQLKVSRYELYLSAYNMLSDSLIQKYHVKKNEDIYFKNSPLIQENEGSLFSPKTRTLKTSKQIFRKMTSGDIGISVYENNGQLEVTLGGKKDVSNSIVAPGIGMGMPIASFEALTLSFNPTMYAFNSYKCTKSVFFKCLFDQNMQHIKGTIKKNPFDRIKDFTDTIYNDVEAETIFSCDNYFIWGYYDMFLKKYYLLKFK